MLTDRPILGTVYTREVVDVIKLCLMVTCFFLFHILYTLIFALQVQCRSASPCIPSPTLAKYTDTISAAACSITPGAALPLHSTNTSTRP